MFKLFRKYQAIIVVVGISLLMVAFLLGDTLQGFMVSTPDDVVIGTINGRDVTLEDQRVAQSELRILYNISPIFSAVTGPPNDDESVMRWLMLGYAAEQLNIQVSQTELQAAMASFGIGETELATLAQKLKTKRASITATMSRWLARERVITLLLGRAHLDIELDPSPGLRRMKAQVQAYISQRELQQAINRGDMAAAEPLYRQFGMSMAIASGSQRVSRPLVEQVVSDQQAEVQASLVLLRPGPLGINPEPSEQLINELFETYKDTPAGEGEPYGFGYRFLDRVRIESITIPFDAVLAKATVDESDALAYYEANKDSFRPRDAEGQPDPAQEPLGYREIRSDIRSFLKRQQALERVETIGRDAIATLEAELRAIPRKEGYYVFPEDFAPMTLRQAADAINQKHGIEPTVRLATPGFVDVRDLEYDPVLGNAIIPTSRNERIGIAQYVGSTRELNPALDNPLLTRYLQTGIPGNLMVDPSGSVIIFRVVEAQPARVPDSVDEVRDAVTADARQLAGYNALVELQQAWADRAQNEPLSDIAAEAAVTEIDSGPFSRRTRDRSGLSAVPTLPGIGQDADFVDALFAKARQLHDQSDIETFQPGERIVVRPIPGALSLALARIDSYTPLNRNRFEMMLQDMTLPALVSESLITGDEPQPLELKVLMKAVGYQPAEGEPLADELETETTTEPPADNESA
ncbi:hypothetical protein [Mucisphaera calidilacus]|uniref:Peptidyl-prolyl cis-trans isomerase D n=1 Tax=Mucisphaera calidilacus TaxID=2527982 RepID=A0A518BZP9_9BACT|nr:hypothetical protein [Mucisphaera calidilacus]QDU72444.1 hypothetical protein Pan265_23090 [Mucisphaera calidilacus]